MRNSLKTVFKKPEFYIIIAAVVLRILLSNSLGAHMPYGPHDDLYYVRSAMGSDFFELHPQFTLIKNASFTVFLWLARAMGLSYPVALSLLWVAGALLTMVTFRYLIQNRVFLTVAFLFVLFTPIAFEASTSTRVYRNGIIAPAVLIVFMLQLLIFFKILADYDISAKKLLAANIWLGVFFAFAFYIKEDGAWLLVCCGAALLVCLCVSAYVCVKKSGGTRAEKLRAIAQKTAVLLLPAAVFVALSNAYKAYNYVNHGIYEVNTRTEGELGRFVELVYSIDSPNRSKVFWAPVDAIESAYYASETFQAFPILLINIYNTPWFDGNILETPITGDFLTWVIRDAIFSSGLWGSEKSLSELFAQINSEIEDALDSGRLKRDTRRRLISSAPGYTDEEIESLKPLTAAVLKSHITLEGYTEGGTANPYTEDHAAEFIAAEILTRTDLYFETPEEAAALQQKMDEANTVVGKLFSVYKVINPVLCAISLAGAAFVLIYALIKAIKKQNIQNRFILPVALLTLLFWAACVMYAFGISWFSAFLSSDSVNYEIMKFYGVGVVPMLAIIELFGAYMAYEAVAEIYGLIKSRRTERKFS